MGGSVVVTGANGLVGARVCVELAGRGVPVRAVVRRPGTAPALADIEETVGDFADPRFAAEVTRGAKAVITTVHPMGTDAETQHRVGVIGTSVIATAARDGGVDRLIHVSTAATYDRSPGNGDMDESSALAGTDGTTYATSKVEVEKALGGIEGITRILLRPPAILGPCDSSVFNALIPAGIRDDEQERHARPEESRPWIHVDDLARLAVDLATDVIADAVDPADGPVAGGCTPVNVAAGPATDRDYFEAVCAALEVDPVWDDGPVWTGQILTDRARGWGWAPQIDLAEALAEVAAGLSPSRP